MLLRLRHPNYSAYREGNMDFHQEIINFAIDASKHKQLTSFKYICRVS